MPFGASNVAQVENPSEPTLPDGAISPRMRIAAGILRALFIAMLALITFRVSLPQNETIWTAYDTPSDVVRMLLGLAVVVWLAFQLFRGPRDQGGYRTWLYLGLVAVPFSLICLVAVW
jgi:FtsH-binding integral membrane protein